MGINSKTIKRNELRIAQYIVAVFLYWVSLYLYYPTLSVYVQSKTNNLAMVGTVLAMYGFWQMAVRIPLGILSDWMNRQKPLIMIGFFLSGLGAIIMAQAGGYWGLMIGRTITGFSASFWVILIVVFSRLFPPQDAVKATALLSLVNSLGRMLATVLTGWLNDLGGYELSFYVACAISVLAILIILPGREHEGTYLTPSFTTVKRLLSNKGLMVPSWLSVLTQYVVFASTFGFIPNLAAQFGASNVVQSLLMSMNLLIITIGNVLVARLVKRYPSSSLIAVSFILLSFGLIIAGFSTSLAMIFIAQVLIGLANGINYPTLMGLSIESIDLRERSTAMGIHQSIYAIGMFTGPWLSGIIAEKTGIESMFLLTGAVCLLVSLIGIRILKRNQTRQSS